MIIDTVRRVRAAFVVLARAADATRELMLGTAVAIAFASSPMTLAQSAHDVHPAQRRQAPAGPRLAGAPHVTRRFGRPRSRPPDRMREYVLALRGIRAAWNDRVPLDFRGEFSAHTLMTPLRSGPSGFGAPPVFLSGVGQRMTAVAGEVADG